MSTQQAFSEGFEKFCADRGIDKVAFLKKLSADSPYGPNLPQPERPPAVQHVSHGEIPGRPVGAVQDLNERAVPNQEYYQVQSGPHAGDQWPTASQGVNANGDAKDTYDPQSAPIAPDVKGYLNPVSQSRSQKFEGAFGKEPSIINKEMLTSMPVGVGALAGAGGMALSDLLRSKEKRRGILTNLLMGGALGAAGGLGYKAYQNYGQNQNWNDALKYELNSKPGAELTTNLPQQPSPAAPAAPVVK